MVESSALDLVRDVILKKAMCIGGSEWDLPLNANNTNGCLENFLAISYYLVLNVKLDGARMLEPVVLGSSSFLLVIRAF